MLRESFPSRDVSVGKYANLNRVHDEQSLCAVDRDEAKIEAMCDSIAGIETSIAVACLEADVGRKRTTGMRGILLGR